MNGECCGSREEGQANDIPATLVVVAEVYTHLEKLFLLCVQGQMEKMDLFPQD